MEQPRSRLWYYRGIGKRTLDVVGASIGIILLLPVLVVIAVVIKLDSRGPVLFAQERVGKGFKLFVVLKFRTMKDRGSGGTARVHDPQRQSITRAGRFLRRFKLDELPQLLNVIMGRMSLVGPRPELERYVTMFRSDYETVLLVRPGITDPASLEYVNESEILSEMGDAEQAYVTAVLPRKIELGRRYVEQCSFKLDILTLLKTLLLLGQQAVPKRFGAR